MKFQNFRKWHREGWGWQKRGDTFARVSIQVSWRGYSFENQCHEVNAAKWPRDKLRIIPPLFHAPSCHVPFLRDQPPPWPFDTAVSVTSARVDYSSDNFSPRAPESRGIFARHFLIVPFLHSNALCALRSSS